MALNNYVAKQLQGLYLCQLVVNYTNNAANGCTALPQNWCTNPPPALDATVSSITLYTKATHSSHSQVSRFPYQYMILC